MLGLRALLCADEAVTTGGGAWTLFCVGPTDADRIFRLRVFRVSGLERPDSEIGGACSRDVVGKTLLTFDVLGGSISKRCGP